MSQTLTGHDAIRYAETHGLRLSKYADPIDGARDGLTVDEAREIAREDPRLVYVAGIVHCECGVTTGTPCEWTGPIADTVLVEYMPEQHRASHEAAGNSGTYPQNGAVRLRVEQGCADRIIESDGPTWARIVE